jgi:signal transduction histidine kinase/ActR/RegA family two-component response regulator
MAVAYLIARRVGRNLVAPIDELVGAATAVSRTRDYSRRAKKLGDDELGELTDAFNEMLEQIEQQERALHSAHAERGALLEGERAARAEAERASRVKDEFLATLSHELRTPLTPIMGWMELLKRADDSGAETRRGLEVVERNARVLTHIIDDLLDMSRIVSGKVRLDVQPVELTEVIEAAITTVRPAAEARSIRIQTVLDPNARWVRGDAARLQQVIWNLLSNAIRFTGKGGRVQVALERVNSHVELSVSDTGAGIAPEFLPHVFDRFRQADSKITRQHGGLGLGLAIVRQLVELHGGSVRASSPGEGQGATFTVELPLMLVHHEENPAQPREHPTLDRGAAPIEGLPSLAGARVLVVEDDADARALMARVVEPHGATVVAAESGAEALRLVELLRPDVLISDIGMPGMDGYELIRRVRELGAARGGATPAIALTAFARSEDRTRALLSGYQLHLAKPVAPAELVVAIASLRTGASAERERSAGGGGPAAG